MHIYHFALIAVALAFFFWELPLSTSKKAKALGIYLLYYFSYSLMRVFDIPPESYYIYYTETAVLSLFAAIALYNINNHAAICSCLLVFVNVFGAVLWWNYLPHISYDIISCLLLITQLVIIVKPQGAVNELFNRVFTHNTAKHRHHH